MPVCGAACYTIMSKMVTHVMCVSWPWRRRRGHAVPARRTPDYAFRSVRAALVCIEYELLHVTARPNPWRGGLVRLRDVLLDRGICLCRRARMLGFMIRIVLGTQLASGKSGPRNSYPRQIICLSPFAVHPQGPGVHRPAGGPCRDQSARSKRCREPFHTADAIELRPSTTALPWL